MGGVNDAPAAATPRPSRNSKRRAVVLVLVHVVLIVHVLWWWFAGRALTPLELSESMAFSTRGIINAGLALFALSTLATLIFGRFFCGWGCHMIALQDGCRWLMRRAGIQPRPLRSRLLKLVPLGAFIYMFLWPVIGRWIAGEPQPGIQGTEWTTAALWATFPGPWVSIASLLVCGVLTVWFLGSKGLCNYACPYGALFGAADAFAPGRIRVDDSCEGCGHCTAVCSSDVRVHAEVRDHGMVVDPGCLKCMDCVSVCPNGALSFGFGKPAAFSSPRPEAEPAPRSRNAPGWGEELLAAAAFAWVFFATRSLYGLVPFLVALSFGALAGWWAITCARLLRRADVRGIRHPLKRDGRLLPHGRVFIAGSVALALFLLHSTWVQSLGMAREASFGATADWRGPALRGEAGAPSEDIQAALDRAGDWARRSARTSLVADGRDDYVFAFEALANGDFPGFEAHFARILELRPGFGEILFQLGHARRGRERFDAAVDAWSQVSARDARFLECRLEMGFLEVFRGRPAAAEELLGDLRRLGYPEHELEPLIHRLEAAPR